MDVALVDDQVSVTGWPAWAEAGEALRATLGEGDDVASCAAETGFCGRLACLIISTGGGQNLQRFG
jgi:hypothetical protein